MLQTAPCDRGEEAERIGDRAPHRDKHRRPLALRERNVNLGSRGLFQRDVSHVADHADDLQLLLFRSEVRQVLPNWILIPENTLRGGRLVDDRDRQATRALSCAVKFRPCKSGMPIVGK